MYEFLSTIYPKKLKESYKKLLIYADVRTESNLFLGFILTFGAVFALGMSLLFARITGWPLFLLLILFFVVFQVIFYFFLVLRSDKKGKFVESVLPDALQLMASNLRAGLTVDRALILSGRPEFGPLQDEINRVGKEITMGKNISDALLSIKDRIKSDKLDKTVLLIVSGLKSGGELAALLEQTSTNLRKQMFVEERVRSSVMMYVMFIFSAVSLGSPMLFGLSSFLVEVLTNVIGNIDMPDAATTTMPISFSDVSISVDFVIIFSVVSLVTSSILGSLVLGLIGKGKEREGLKYIPFLILISVGIFFLVRIIIKSALGGLFDM